MFRLDLLAGSRVMGCKFADTKQEARTMSDNFTDEGYIVYTYDLGIRPFEDTPILEAVEWSATKNSHNPDLIGAAKTWT